MAFELGLVLVEQRGDVGNVAPHDRALLGGEGHAAQPFAAPPLEEDEVEHARRVPPRKGGRRVCPRRRDPVFPPLRRQPYFAPTVTARSRGSPPRKMRRVACLPIRSSASSACSWVRSDSGCPSNPSSTSPSTRPAAAAVLSGCTPTTIRPTDWPSRCSRSACSRTG